VPRETVRRRLTIGWRWPFEGYLPRRPGRYGGAAGCGPAV